MLLSCGEAYGRLIPTVAKTIPSLPLMPKMAHARILQVPQANILRELSRPPRQPRLKQLRNQAPAVRHDNARDLPEELRV